MGVSLVDYIFKTRRQAFSVKDLIVRILIGGVFTAFGFFAVASLDIDEDWVIISGKIADVSTSNRDGSTMYTAVVSYKVGNQDYRIRSKVSSSIRPQLGREKEVAYNPKDPTQAKIVEGKGVSILFWFTPIMGLLVLVSGPISFIKSFKRTRDIKHLQQYGQKIQGVISDIQTIGNDGGKTYKIVVSATDSSNSVCHYVSDPITGIPSLILLDLRDKAVLIDVYVDSLDSKRYYVDISDIPSLTPERINDLIKSVKKDQYPTSI